MCFGPCTMNSGWSWLKNRRQSGIHEAQYNKVGYRVLDLIKHGPGEPGIGYIGLLHSTVVDDRNIFMLIF